MNSLRSLALCACVPGFSLALVSPCVAQDADDDGFDDLAVAVARQEVGGSAEAGAVQVFRGSSNGITPSDKLFTQDSGGIEDTAESGDAFGDVLAWGDFDDDGFDDLAIGIPLENIGGATNAGAVAVLYGSSNGVSTNGDQFFSQNTAGISGVAEDGDFFGVALAVGDFDGDGFDDLAIGATGQVVNGAIGGVVHVLYGSSAGLSASGDQLWSQNTTGVPDAAETGDEFGWALTAGDFNGDGRDDLAIGAYGEDIGAANGAGQVHVLYGRNSGLKATGDQVWNQNTSGIPDSCESGDFFGYTLVAGDFDGDGEDDLAISVIGESISGQSEAGAVHVLYGSNNGLRATADDFWHQDVAGISGTAGAGDNFGFALCAGDFDGDGREDLAIGIPRENSSGESNSGAVAVLYGDNGGLTDAGDQLWTQDSGTIGDDAEEGDQFGHTLYSGDFNGDGREDLLVAAPFQDVNGISDAGVVHVIRGASSGLVTAGNQLISQDLSGALGDAEEDEAFGMQRGAL